MNVGKDDNKDWEIPVVTGMLPAVCKCRFVDITACLRSVAMDGSFKATAQRSALLTLSESQSLIYRGGVCHRRHVSQSSRQSLMASGQSHFDLTVGFVQQDKSIQQRIEEEAPGLA